MDGYHQILSKKIFMIIFYLIQLTKCDDQFYAGVDLTANYIVSNHESILPIESQITFWLFSPSEPDMVRQIFVDDAATYIGNSYVYGFLIHGWLGGFRGGYLADYSQNDEWLEETAREWANQGWSVIVVDWSQLANYEYSISAKNTRTVAEFITQFIIANNLNPRLITLTGHSLGSHVCGFIGQSLNDELYQIIGLDPAGPLFTIPLDVGVDQRLSPNDAFYVQTIHTACGTLGTQKNMGHADFYVNGGAIQPGCLFDDADDDGILSCSHSRAYQYFKASLSLDNLFFGTKCNDLFDCSAVDSIISSIPIIGLSLDNRLLSITCEHADVIALFGIHGGKMIGSFDIQLQSANEPYV